MYVETMVLVFLVHIHVHFMQYVVLLQVISNGTVVFLVIHGVFITGDLSQYIWYHGSIEKQVAKERLKGKEVRHVYS